MKKYFVKNSHAYIQKNLIFKLPHSPHVYPYIETFVIVNFWAYNPLAADDDDSATAWMTEIFKNW